MCPVGQVSVTNIAINLFHEFINLDHLRSWGIKWFLLLLEFYEMEKFLILNVSDDIPQKAQ